MRVRHLRHGGAQCVRRLPKVRMPSQSTSTKAAAAARQKSARKPAACTTAAPVSAAPATVRRTPAAPFWKTNGTF